MDSKGRNGRQAISQTRATDMGTGGFEVAAMPAVANADPSAPRSGVGMGSRGSVTLDQIQLPTQPGRLGPETKHQVDLEHWVVFFVVRYYLLDALGLGPP